jgi:hypothetical protein
MIFFENKLITIKIIVADRLLVSEESFHFLFLIYFLHIGFDCAAGRI